MIEKNFIPSHLSQNFNVPAKMGKVEKHNPESPFASGDSVVKGDSGETDFPHRFKVFFLQTPQEASSPNKSGTVISDFISFKNSLLHNLGEHTDIEDSLQGVLPGSIPTVSQMNEIFAEAAGDKDIAWEYIKDGCEARAHMTCKKFLDKGYGAAKLFPKIDFQERPLSLFKMENKFMKADWRYHVAALTFAKDDKTGKVDGYIIDPSVNSERPIKADEWIKSFWRGGNHHITVTIAQAHATERCGLSDKVFSREVFDKRTDSSISENRKYSQALEEVKEAYNNTGSGRKPLIN